MLGHPEDALSTLDTALARINEANRPLAALALQSLKVECLTVLGRLRAAVDMLRDALELARRMREPVYRYYEGSLLSSVGSIYRRIRQIESAVPIELEALQVARELHSRVAEANQLASLGVLCGMLVAEWSAGDLSLDRRWSLLESIATATLRDSAGPWTVDASDRRADTFDQRAGDVGQALLRRAAQVYRETGDLTGEAVALGDLNNFLEGEDQPMIEALEEALGRLRQAQGSPRSEAILLANLGKSYLRVGRVADARACLEYSLLLSESNGDYEWAYDTASDLATTYLKDGQFADAAKYLRQAIDYTEAERRGVPLGDVARTAFARGKQAAYARLAWLYTQRGRTADAYDVAQRAKSRALVDLAALGTFSPTVSVTPELVSLLEKERALHAELRARAADASLLPSARMRPLSELQADIDATYERMQEIDPRYVSMRSGRPIRLRELKETLAAQGRPALLVDYFLEENTLLIFLMRADWQSPEYLELEIDARQLVSKRGEFERQVITYRGRGPQTWTSIGRIVLDPILDFLREGDLIYVVPHGRLHGLPIHALPVRGRPLMESHPVLYLPAASLLPICQAPGKSPDQLRTCCAVGVEFDEEARSVADVFERSELMTGDIDVNRIANATKNGWDVYHFSCHGHYDPLDPRRSGLVLRPMVDPTAPSLEVVLTSDEIVGMCFDSELVCLSACQSGVGRVVQGDEQMGILRAFFLAGASSVMSTLWPVEAEATRAFMETFYAHLLGAFRETGCIDKAAALQAAQLEIMRRHGPAGAYYWAPFVLSGDWK
jgi:tetratricopeptide (TPR) repeat protein